MYRIYNQFIIIILTTYHCRNKVFHIVMWFFCIQRCPHEIDRLLEIMACVHWQYNAIQISPQFLVGMSGVDGADWSFESFCSVMKLPDAHEVVISGVCHYIMPIDCSDRCWCQRCNLWSDVT